MIEQDLRALLDRGAGVLIPREGVEPSEKVLDEIAARIREASAVLDRLSAEVVRERERILTGHGDLRVGGFGWWRCRACGRAGDEYADPADVPCEPLSEESV